MMNDCESLETEIVATADALFTGVFVDLCSLWNFGS